MAAKKIPPLKRPGENWPADHVERRKVNELVPYAKNSRTHSAEQIGQIAASIEEWGFANPVLIGDDGTIIAGHGRVLAAKKLGLDEVPVMVAAGWSEDQKRAYVIADNKLTLNGGWDNDLLKVEFADLEASGFDLGKLGFSTPELAAVRDVRPAGLVDPDEAPEPPAVPVAIRGDLWALGRHRLMCGDSTSIDAVERLKAGSAVSMVFTDPPYGVSYQSNMRTKSRKFGLLKNDHTVLNIAPVLEATTKGWVFVWTSWKVQTKWIEIFSAWGYPTNIVIWHKPGGGIGDLKRTFSSDYEVALVWHRGAGLCGKRIGSVWTINKDGATTYVHPTQKPVALAEEAMDKTTPRGAVVLDLFGGSGSTLIACERTGRDARLMEIDPAYCDVIIQRWQNFTGLVATLNGISFEEVAKERRKQAA